MMKNKPFFIMMKDEPFFIMMKKKNESFFVILFS